VHDASQTGGTLFVEPPAAVEAGNRIRELQSEEIEEVERILAELTEKVRPHRDELAESLEALIVLDSLVARARYAVEFRCAPADLADSTEGFAIVQGRHPLLIAQGIDVVPFDLVMLPNERTLLISGPNTGGKTVLLKALGLFSGLVQSGIPAPVAAGSRIAIFDNIYADVGDEQSILASLSTFSAHIKNLVEVLSSATAHSLVLIDELGSGTDPIEGAALGGAILEALTARGTLTVATTHPWSPQGVGDPGKRSSERLPPVRSGRPRANVSSHQGSAGPLVWNQHRASAESAGSRVGARGAADSVGRA